MWENERKNIGFFENIWEIHRWKSMEPMGKASNEMGGISSWRDFNPTWFQAISCNHQCGFNVLPPRKKRKEPSANWNGSFSLISIFKSTEMTRNNSSNSNLSYQRMFISNHSHLSPLSIKEVFLFLQKSMNVDIPSIPRLQNWGVAFASFDLPSAPCGWSIGHLQVFAVCGGEVESCCRSGSRLGWFMPVYSRYIGISW